MNRGFLRYGGRSSLGEVSPAAALFTLLSTFLLPGMPICPAVHLSVNEYLCLLWCFYVRKARSRISCARWCLGFLNSELKALSAAWLSTTMQHEVVPHLSVLTRCIASRSSTSSASCIMCSTSGPRWKCSVQMGLSFLISIAAALTLPPCAEPSMKT
jgi:hypothetical protein